MSSADIANLVVGLLQLALALVVLRGLGRLGRRFPWLAALLFFFLLRGAERVYTAFGGDESGALSYLTDWALVVILVLLLFGLARTVNGLRAVEDAAAFRQEEYARAVGDYRALARHRLANPLTVIRGGIATLKSWPELNDATRTQVLDAMEHEADELEKVALDPRVVHESEHELAPEPRLGTPDRS